MLRLTILVQVQNFRPTPNFLAKALRAFAQLLPPWAETHLNSADSAEGFSIKKFSLDSFNQSIQGLTISNKLIKWTNFLHLTDFSVHPVIILQLDISIINISMTNIKPLRLSGDPFLIPTWSSSLWSLLICIGGWSTWWAIVDDKWST